MFIILRVFVFEKSMNMSVFFFSWIKDKLGFLDKNQMLLHQYKHYCLASSGF